MNILTGCLISLVLLQGGVILFFVLRYFNMKKIKVNVEVPELIDINFNRTIFFELLEDCLDQYELDEVDKLLALDDEIMKKIEQNLLPAEKIIGYNNFIVSSMETVGTELFNLYLAIDEVANLLCI